MIKAILLDLDNTLLVNPDDHFVAKYRQLFDAHFQDCFGIEGASDALRRSFRIIGQETEGWPTNARLIQRCMSQILGLRVNDIAYAFDAFHRGRYRELRRHTAPMDGAARLVEDLIEAGIAVAIATNPIHSETAVMQRLDWAGLTPYVDSFAFVTHSENMHFMKPDPAYFAEAVARIGVEPDEALVIGDSPTNDISPAQAIGLYAWQVETGAGLAAVMRRLDEPDWQSALTPAELNPGMLEPQFRGNLAALSGLLAEVRDNQWLQRPDPEEWSILQILCHLWSAEREVHQKRLRTILTEDNPFIPSVAPPGPDIPACHDDGIEVFRNFQQDRRRTMDILKAVKTQDWMRPARHSIFGLTDLLEMAYFTAQHDRLHINQLCQTLGKCDD